MDTDLTGPRATRALRRAWSMAAEGTTGPRASQPLRRAGARRGARA